MLRTAIIVTLSVVLLAGCATHNLQFNTVPQGAHIVHRQGGYVGVSPVIMDYGNEGQFKNAQGCYQVQGVVATWPSGAQAISDEVILLCNGPGDYHFTLTRPADVAGHDVDAQNALVVQQQRLYEQQEQMRQDQANALLLQSVMGVVDAYNQGSAQGQQKAQREQLSLQQQELARKQRQLEQQQRALQNKRYNCDVRENAFGSYDAECR
jgi:hypothetical protein